MVSQRGRLAHTRSHREPCQLRSAKRGCLLQRSLWHWLWLTSLRLELQFFEQSRLYANPSFFEVVTGVQAAAKSSDCFSPVLAPHRDSLWRITIIQSVSEVVGLHAAKVADHRPHVVAAFFCASPGPDSVASKRFREDLVESRRLP